MHAPFGSRDEAGALRLVRLSMLGLVCAVGALALLVALTVPYHATDAFVYGSWSRRIADTGSYHLDGIGNAFLSRPLFLASQGWLWHIVGVHEWMGRVFSLGFGVLLVASVAWLAKDVMPALLAAIVLLAIPEFIQNAFSGLTDVPGTGLTALAAGLMWKRPEGASRALLLVAVAAAAVLAKSTMLPAVVGLGLAHLVGPRRELPARMMWGCVPLAVGVAMALAYDATQAHYLHQGLYTFLTGGNAADPHGAATANLNLRINEQGLQSVVLGVEWLGPYLVLPLLFGGTYALARIARLRHRSAATLAAPVAVIASALLPWLASDVGGRTVGSFDTSRPAAVLLTVALLVPIWLARHCPEDRAPTSVDLARWVVWSIPTLVAWEQVAPYNVRYVAGVWAPLTLLIGAGIWIAALGTAARLQARLGAHAATAGAAVLAVSLVMAVVDLRNFDALGARPDGSINAARFFGDIGVRGWWHPARARTAADPQLGDMLAATRAAAGDRGRVLTNDGRYGFFFPGRLRVDFPPSCSAARGFAAISLIVNVLSPLSEDRFRRLSPAARRVLERGRPDPRRLSHCPGLRQVAATRGSFVVFAHG